MPVYTEPIRRTKQMTFSYYAHSHLGCLVQLVGLIDYESVKDIGNLLQGDKTIFICGNGGSAATASHFAEDLSYWAKKGIRAISLTDNTPLMTAISNDEGYDKVFTRQLENLFREGDIVIGISASGNSPNVVNALEYANSHRGVSIGLLGFDGGVAKARCQHYILIESDDYGLIEDMHLILVHLIAGWLRNERD